MQTIDKKDMSDWVVHLTRVDRNKPDLDPFITLISILREKRLRGGTGFIIEGRTAVCFTESTLETLHDLFRRRDHGIRYRPYGIMIQKYFMFSFGGRPVIYQPKEDLVLLDESKRHLHVTYQLCSSDNADFTWEREWRLGKEELPLMPYYCKVLVPNHATRELVGKLLTEGDDPPGDPWDYQILSDLDGEEPVAPEEVL